MRAYDVTIIGGGIMGLLSAYEIAHSGRRVLLLEKAAIGSSAAASSGLTRSLRNDYENPTYSALARQAWNGWKDLETAFKKRLIVRSGCLNIAAKSKSYAHDAAVWLRRDDNPFREYVSGSELRSDFSQFAGVEYAILDEEAGLGVANNALIAVSGYLQKLPNVDIRLHSTVLSIQDGKVVTSQQTFSTSKIVIAAGLGSSELLKKIEGSTYTLSLRPDRPAECVYYCPRNKDEYYAESFPVFAYLDKGIYGHPIVSGITDSVKIGLYKPPSIVSGGSKALYSDIDEFVREFLPSLKANSSVRPVVDTDLCYYDMTTDDNFVVGQLPNSPAIVIAAGFCGTGYKFAPVIAQVVSDLTANNPARYSIKEFDPARFTRGYSITSK